ncbi:hypothetical protein K7432_010741 [Basidiobolus ranarum]|uniref:Uncharacterized protein n=1 Tax=Basidiobolus ranarum TaxID=34480 RepID=A0ABR2WNC8_9FUNG
MLRDSYPPLHLYKIAGYDTVPRRVKITRIQMIFFIVTGMLLISGFLRFADDNFQLSQEPPLKFTIVTAASENHWCPLQGFLFSLKNTLDFLPANLKPQIIVYDLGLNQGQRQELRNIRDNEGLLDQLVTFNYSMYPSFWNLKENRGEYAWKAGIISEVSKSNPGIVLWMDSGNRVFPNFLVDIVDFIKKHGFYSPTSSGNVRKWTHPGLFDFFQDDFESYAEEVNCNGAFIGVDSNNPEVRDTLIEPFVECARNKECIAPEGSSRANHRQDQSVLTYLVLKSKFRCSAERLTGLMIHQDSDCKSQIEGHLRKLEYS